MNEGVSSSIWDAGRNITNLTPTESRRGKMSAYMACADFSWPVNVQGSSLSYPD